VNELVSQGTELHNQGKYNEAILKYKEALDIDNKSTLANYELSFTYFTINQYHEAIYYSKKVVKQNKENLLQAYVILGSALDLEGKSKEAIKTYEKGLKKYPSSNLLNYNLALTLYNIGDLDKAKDAAIKAIVARPNHGSSHLILASIMIDKNERIKALLPLYYFLMLEPNSKRSITNYKYLRKLLKQGVEKKDDKNINININIDKSSDNEFGPAEMMISIVEASKYTEDNKNKSEMEMFIETNKSLFSILGELKKDNKGFWWDLYVPKFYDLIQTDNLDAFSYYISQSNNSKDINNWISNNQIKIESLKKWIEQ
jgi:tetratricopeptide (TPR) repeat protein